MSPAATTTDFYSSISAPASELRLYKNYRLLCHQLELSFLSYMILFSDGSTIRNNNKW